MRSIFLLAALSLSSAWAGTAPIPKDLPKPVAEKVRSVEAKLKNFDCPFLVQTYYPKDLKMNQFGFCLYPIQIDQGIFQATTCVGVIVEPDTQTRPPFYGKSGHWGIEGKCDPALLRKKFVDPEIDKTVNPITSLRIKRQEGMRIRLLRDDFGIWDLFEKRTAPKTK